MTNTDRRTLPDFILAARQGNDAIRAAGWTPCPHSWFATADRVFCFSSESAGGTSSTGPAFEAVVNVDTGRLHTIGRAR